MFGYWKKVPGHYANVLRGQQPTPYGYQGGYYQVEWVEYEWVAEPLLVGGDDGVFGWIFYVIIVVVVIAVIAIYEYHVNAYSDRAYNSVQNGIPSTWNGDELQYNFAGYIGNGHTDMILTIDSRQKGSFYGTVEWPSFGDTVTQAVGTILTDVSHNKDTHWKYVHQCSKEIYLQFTETEYIQGNSVILNAAYYAGVCDGTLGGVWFYPDGPHDEWHPDVLGGEFSLQWQSS